MNNIDEHVKEYLHEWIMDDDQFEMTPEQCEVDGDYELPNDYSVIIHYEEHDFESEYIEECRWENFETNADYKQVLEVVAEALGEIDSDIDPVKYVKERVWGPWRS